MGYLHSGIETLSAAEKFELIDALWESLDKSPADLTHEQRAELDNRMAEYQKDPSNVIPWEQILADRS